MSRISTDSADPRDARILELEEALERLRARVAKLESEKAALLKADNERRYERPPHY